MSSALRTECDVLRTLAGGTYTLDELYALVAEGADVAREDGFGPSTPAHPRDLRWRHRVRGWLANQRRSQRAWRIRRSVWVLEGTRDRPRSLLLLSADGSEEQIELQVRDAVELLSELEQPVDAVICDPPWGLQWDREGSRSQYARDESKVIGGYVEVPAERYLRFTRRWIAAAAKTLRPAGQLAVVTGPQRAAHAQVAAEEAGLVWVTTIVALREFIAPSRRRPSPGHWAITVMCSGRVDDRRRVFNPPVDQRRSKTGGLYPTTWWMENGRSDRPGRLRYATMLPARLTRRLVVTFTNEGELVCDPMLGGGEVAIACRALGRRFIGGDLNPQAVKFTAARMLAEHAWPAERQPSLFETVA